MKTKRIAIGVVVLAAAACGQGLDTSGTGPIGGNGGEAGADGNGGGAGSAGSAGRTGSCAEVTCDAPPPDRCIDANTLAVFSPRGACTDGACSYSSSPLACTDGCVDGACNGAGAGGSGMDAGSDVEASDGDGATTEPADGGGDDAAGEVDASLDGGDEEPPGDASVEEPPDGGWPVRPIPKFRKLDELCKLISNKNLDDPTANDTHHRYNLRGTDLGIPLAHGSDLYFFFGDTAGYKGIWPLGPQSLPDAVGYAGEPAKVAKSPSVLCSTLKFLTVGSGAVGPTIDDKILADFAGGAMKAPPGQSLGDYIHNAAGTRGANSFPSLPGDFEVPSGAFSYGGDVYIFYTTVQVDPLEMKGSYLAKWTAPATSKQPNYDILYQVDQRFDTKGALRGDFINVAPLVVGDYLYLYGTGKYRQSVVHLARKPLAGLANPGGYESYDAATKTWVAGNAPAAPVVGNAKIGELSVQYFPRLGLYAMMDQEVDGSGNHIMARFAHAPEGPFSAPLVMGTMQDPLFMGTYCCFNGDCSGKRLFNCLKAGFYGTYMLPEPIVNTDDTFTLTFTMSTWDPYNVALMQATFK